MSIITSIYFKYNWRSCLSRQDMINTSFFQQFSLIFSGLLFYAIVFLILICYNKIKEKIVFSRLSTRRLIERRILMGIINPNAPVPNITPIGPGPGGFTPLEKMLIDSFAPSIGTILPTPPIDASNPQISMAEFFSSVSSAQLKQKLQDYINRITDPTIRQALLVEVAKRAGAIADIISIIVQYRELLFRLDQLNLTGKQKRLNDAIDNFNNNTSGDSSQVADMNAAISTYNSAQTSYQSALTTYQTALSTFTVAQGVYNTALTTWNTALNSYNNGGITQAQLESARSTFNSAQSTFNSAKTAMTNATSTFDVAKTAWQDAKTDLDSAATTYNNYVLSREGDLPGAKNDYNSTIQQALPILNDMNAIQDFLFGSTTLQTPTNYTGSTGLETFSLGTPGPDVLRNQVQGVLDTSNGSTGNINTLIGQITSIIGTINGGGYAPPLVAPSILTNITDLPTENANYVLDPVGYNPPSKDTFDFKALTVFDTDFLQALLDAVNEYNVTSDKDENFQKQITDEIKTVLLGLPNSSTGIGSSVSVTANTSTVGARSNPHLLGALSKHVFETVLDVYGVPATSPLASSLADQLGALVYGYKIANGLTSLGAAQTILGDNPVPPGPEGAKGVSAALALGNLSQVQDLVLSDQITQDITRIVNANPAFANLSPEQKTALIQTLVQEVGVSLIKAALGQLAASIDLPGLVAQILANLSTLQAAPGAPETNLKEIVAQLILSQELAKQLGISKTQAEDIVRNAIRELALKNQAATQDAITQAILDQIRADQALNSQVSANAAQRSAVQEDAVQTQISADAALEAEIHASVIKADVATSARVQAEADRSDLAKRDAIANSIRADLEARHEDPVKIKRLISDFYRPTILNALISGLIKPNFLEALTNHLIKLPLEPGEAATIAKTALNKATAKDAALNPLSTFMGNQVLGLPDLTGLFKVQVANILTPVVGQAHALDVAENYGRLIFANPNSVTKLLERNEKSLSALAGYNFDARVFEDFRNADQILINPTASPDNPAHNGNVILLSGQAAGLSVQGTTSADNTLGPSGYHNKNPINFPS